MVHKRRDLEPIIKFQYLRNTLSGEAAELTQGIEVSELNYALALSLLQKRYGDRNKVKQLIIAQFHALKTPKYEPKEL